MKMRDGGGVPFHAISLLVWFQIQSSCRSMPSQAAPWGAKDVVDFLAIFNLPDGLLDRVQAIVEGERFAPLLVSMPALLAQAGLQDARMLNIIDFEWKKVAAKLAAQHSLLPSSKQVSRLPPPCPALAYELTPPPQGDLHQLSTDSHSLVVPDFDAHERREAAVQTVCREEVQLLTAELARRDEQLAAANRRLQGQQQLEEQLVALQAGHRRERAASRAQVDGLVRALREMSAAYEDLLHIHPGPDSRAELHALRRLLEQQEQAVLRGAGAEELKWHTPSAPAQHRDEEVRDFFRDLQAPARTSRKAQRLMELIASSGTGAASGYGMYEDDLPSLQPRGGGERSKVKPNTIVLPLSPTNRSNSSSSKSGGGSAAAGRNPEQVQQPTQSLPVDYLQHLDREAIQNILYKAKRPSSAGSGSGRTQTTLSSKSSGRSSSKLDIRRPGRPVVGYSFNVREVLATMNTNHF